MKNKLVYLALFTAATAFIGGCASKNASYVESGGTRTIISTNKINIADWNNAAASLTNELLSSGKLETVPEKQPVKMLVSRVINRTSDNIDTDMLTRKITMVLGNSGKVRVVSQDAATSELAEYEAEMSGKKVSKPKLTLTGKILEDRESNSDLREVTYTFFLEVNYRGTPIWAGEKQITKQSEKGLFGM